MIANMVCRDCFCRLGKCVLPLFLFFVSCERSGVPGGNSGIREDSLLVDSLQVDSLPMDEPMAEEDTLHTLRIGFVGDIMVHDYQMEKAYDEKTDSFDFSPVFKQIQPFLDANGLLIGNLETVFAGKNKGRSSKVHGYASFPYFNAPDCFAATLAEAGFDLLATANNHTMDCKPEGVVATLNLLDSLGILHHGTSRDSLERERLCIVERGGIKVGFCSYTYSLNGVFVPKDKRFMVNEFCKYDSAKVSGLCENVRRLRTSGADFTVAYLHCGTEYQKNPNRYQRQMADSLHHAGCDLVVMSHPHIIQRMEVLPAEDSLPRTLVAYSLGNFVSSQVCRGDISKDLGMILQVDVEKRRDSVSISGVTVVPTCTYWRRDHIGVLPVITAFETPDSVIALRPKEKVRVVEAYDEVMDVLGGDADSLWRVEGDHYRFKW